MDMLHLQKLKGPDWWIFSENMDVQASFICQIYWCVSGIPQNAPAKMPVGIILSFS